MNGRNGSLLNLVLLLEDQLPPAKARDARLSLQDPQVRRRWNRLLHARDLPPEQLPAESPAEPLDAELLAAFVDGKLPDATAARIEQLCWSSNRLLNELISTVRFRAERDVVGREPGFTERMLVRFDHQFPAAELPAELPAEPLAKPLADRRLGDQATRPADERPSEWVGVVDHHGTPHLRRVKLSRQGNRGLYWIAAVAGTAAAIAFVAGALVLETKRVAESGQTGEQYGNTAIRRAPPDDRERAADSNGNARRNATGSTAHDLADSPPGRGAVGQRGNRSADADGNGAGNVNGPPITPESDSEHSVTPAARVPKITDVAGSPRTPEPAPPAPDSRSVRPMPMRGAPGPDPAARRSRPIALQWEDIDGLLVGRESISGDWRGAYSYPPLPTESQFAVLPGSWAQAQTARGRLILADDAQVALSGSEESPTIQLDRGRLGLDGVPAEQSWQLSVGDTSWTIQSNEDATSLGIVAGDDEPILFVRRGEVTVGETRIGQRRQVQLSAGGPGPASPLRAETGWIDRPDHPIRLDATTQATLLASRQMFEDLANLRIGAAPVSRSATLWTLALFPERSVAEVFQAADPAVRRDAFLWLLAQRHDDPRTRLVWRTLAQQTGDGGVVRLMMQWQGLLRQHRPIQTEVAPTDAARMVRALDHPDPLLRQLANQFLEHGFGHALPRPIAYAPLGPVAARQQAIREWLIVLRLVYSRNG